MKIKIPFVTVLYVSIMLLILIGCAQQVPPDGGQKDEIPPKVIGSKPINKTIQFNSEKAEIIFDEYIQIKELKNIIISPKITQKPIIVTNGKKLEIQFIKKSLDTNTTYTINIGNAISDIHEGKLIENYNFIFSTGRWIDSSQIKGIILDSETNLPIKDITVALSKLPQNKDSVIYKKEITYLTKTNENGTYNLTNIPSNTFEILAFKDENNNNQIDKSEKIGFYNETLNTDKNNEEINIKLFKQPDYQSDKLIDTVYNKIGIIKFIIYDHINAEIVPLNNSAPNYYKKIKGNEKYDTIQFYLGLSNDSLPQRFTLKRNLIKDTITITGKRIKSKDVEEQTINITVPEKQGDSIHIQFKQPVTEFASEKLILKQDSIIIQNLEWKKLDPFNYYLSKKLEETINYSLEIKDSATKNIYKKYSKGQNIKFTIPNQEDFGTINIISNSTNSNNILIQIKDNKDVIYNEKLNKGNNILKYIKPGTYILRLVNDTNANNKWDDGNIVTRQQPELIKILNNELKIKANWETEIILTNEELTFD